MGCSRTSSPSRNCRQWCGCWLQKMHARDWICGSLLFFTATGTIFQTKQTSDINFNTEMSGVSAAKGRILHHPSKLWICTTPGQDDQEVLSRAQCHQIWDEEGWHRLLSDSSPLSSPLFSHDMVSSKQREEAGPLGCRKTFRTVTWFCQDESKTVSL